MAEPAAPQSAAAAVAEAMSSDPNPAAAQTVVADTSAAHAATGPADPPAASGAVPASGTEPAATAVAPDAPVAQALKEAPQEASAPAEPAVEAPVAPVDPAAQAVNDQLAACRENPAGFDKWVTLITAAEKLGDIVKLREVYDGFLAEFPLCYGYWKKYADAEHRNGSPELATSVFDRGTAAIPYSVDLWGHMCTYKIQQKASAEEVRMLFEQGLAYVGTDYLAHGLWDKYLAYELAQGDTLRVASVYQQVLGSPIRELDRYFNSVKDFASQRPLAALIPSEELGRMRSELQAEAQAAADAAAAAAPAAAEVPAADVKPAAAGEDTPMADAAPAAAAPSAAVPDVKPAVADTEMAPAEAAPAAADAIKAESVPAEAVKAENGPVAAAAPAAVPAVTDEEVKARWLGGLTSLHEGTKAERSRRQPFEDSIKRPYFHVKPLDALQLSTWSRYLDFMDQKGDAGAAVRLYERCVVPCASYPEYWARYVRYLEGSGDVAGARAALQRATLVHCKLQPDIHVFSALFEERHGEVEAARAEYSLIQTKLAVGLVSALVQHANFERRQGQMAAAKALYEAFITQEGSKDDSVTYAFGVVQYSAFLQQAAGDLAGAQAAFAAALGKRTNVKALWEGAIHVEERIAGADQAQRVLALYARAVAPGAGALTSAEREDLSARSVTAADMLGSAADVEAASAAHAALVATLPKPKATTTGKRAAEGAAGGTAKQARTSTPAASATPAAAAPVASAAAANPYAAYGQYPYSSY